MTDQPTPEQLDPAGGARGWQPIETAPQDDREFIAHDAKTGTTHVTFRDQWGDFHDPGSHYYSEEPAFVPTHWTDLIPRPPRQT